MLLLFIAVNQRATHVCGTHHATNQKLLPEASLWKRKLPKVTHVTHIIFGPSPISFSVSDSPLNSTFKCTWDPHFVGIYLHIHLDLLNVNAYVFHIHLLSSAVRPHCLRVAITYYIPSFPNLLLIFSSYNMLIIWLFNILKIRSWLKLFSNFYESIITWNATKNYLYKA